jgi:hypothetical protein
MITAISNWQLFFIYNIAYEVPKFCMVPPTTCASSVWNLLFVIFLAPRILMWLIHFWKICASLASCHLLTAIIKSTKTDYSNCTCSTVSSRMDFSGCQQWHAMAQKAQKRSQFFQDIPSNRQWIMERLKNATQEVRSRFQNTAVQLNAYMSYLCLLSLLSWMV